jgi:N-acetylmuramoyl-L-alanine amidase
MARKKVVAKKRPAKKKAARRIGMDFHTGTGAGHVPKPPVTWIPSPNFASRNGIEIDTLILHNTDGTLASAIQRFKDPSSQVSAHYIVDRDGGVTQMVNDTDTAWHSGKKDVNQRSIGIEVVASSTATGMTTGQEATLIALAQFVLDAYSVAVQRVFPHRDIKPTDCPGWVWATDPIFIAWTAAKLHDGI